HGARHRANCRRGRRVGKNERRNNFTGDTATGKTSSDASRDLSGKKRGTQSRGESLVTRKRWKTSRSLADAEVWLSNKPRQTQLRLVSFSARSFRAALRESFTRPLSSMPMHFTQMISPTL